MMTSISMKRKMEEIVLYGWQPIQTSSARKLMVLQEKMYDSIVPLFVKPSASLPQVLPSCLRQVPPQLRQHYVVVRDVVREKEANHQEKEEVNQKGKDQEKEEANLKEKEETNLEGNHQEKEEANQKGNHQEKEEANLKGKDQEKEDPAARMQERGNLSEENFETTYARSRNSLAFATALYDGQPKCQETIKY